MVSGDKRAAVADPCLIVPLSAGVTDELQHIHQLVYHKLLKIVDITV